LALLKARVRVQLRRKQFEDQDRIIREELRHQELQSVQTRELEQRNSELEAFAHAVSHDLRSPLRTIRGFTQALLEDFDGQLPAAARDHLVRVMAGALRMSKLIDTLLELSRSSRVDLRRQAFDLSCLARSVANELAESDRRRQVDCSVQECLPVTADPALIRIVLENLMGNAWKFTAKAAHPAIEVGALSGNGGPVYFVRDNGAGFDAARAQRLFQPFERLHAATDFPGTGIGLSTTRRIVERHGGEIWAESTPAAGATFFFTLAES
jgi:signal transduction histidine kinase